MNNYKLFAIIIEAVFHNNYKIREAFEHCAPIASRK